MTAPRERGLGGTQVEGRQAVRELLLAGRRTVYEILLSTELEHSDVVGDIVDLADELRVPVTEVSRTRLDSLARTDAPQGVVARAGELPDVELESLIRPAKGRSDDTASPPFLLAVDGVTDPGNLGALLRIAECAGVTGVVLPRHRAVHVTPTVTKAAAGAVEYLSMSLVAGLATAVTTLRDAGVWVVGLDAEGDTPIHELTVADSPVCLVVGAEGPGLSTLVRQRCDVLAERSDDERRFGLHRSGSTDPPGDHRGPVQLHAGRRHVRRGGDRRVRRHGLLLRRSCWRARRRGGRRRGA